MKPFWGYRSFGTPLVQIGIEIGYGLAAAALAMTVAEPLWREPCRNLREIVPRTYFSWMLPWPVYAFYYTTMLFARVKNPIIPNATVTNFVVGVYTGANAILAVKAVHAQRRPRRDRAAAAARSL